MHSSIRNLMTGLIDYAGLFPPAGLDMQTAFGNFERYRAGEFAWMLGRFIVPAARMVELPNASMPLSVLAGNNLEQDLALIRGFVARHPGSIEMIEVKALEVDRIDAISKLTPEELPVFFEIPPDIISGTLIDALTLSGGCAKVRTGGVTADAFPDSRELARFLEVCSEGGVPFKATAGLHHPMRSWQALTYEAHSPSAMMHGFLNVFLAAGFARQNIGTALVSEVIEEESDRAFQFTDDGVTWRNQSLTSDEIAATRRDFAVSFGSCSFEEPVQDLCAMGLL